jgi:hypothetical protein
MCHPSAKREDLILLLWLLLFPLRTSVKPLRTSAFVFCFCPLLTTDDCLKKVTPKNYVR